MTAAPFDFTPLLPADLLPAAARWTGRPKYDFTGGNNDPDALPLDGLIAAADAVLRREGRTLSTYGLNSGPQGYKLKVPESICSARNPGPFNPSPQYTSSWLPT